MTAQEFTRRHLHVGWLSITIFVALGIGLEALHAFKAGYLLDVQNETRRLMWSLAHAHGTLIGVLNLAAAFTASRVEHWRESTMGLVSRMMLAATLFVPAGFFLGGFGIDGGDPGLGVLLVPPGGLLLLGAVGMLAYATRASEGR